MVPKAFPLEFRRDVVAVARKSDESIANIAKGFGISESCLQRWLAKADVEDGVRPGVTDTESAELREAKKRIRMLEQENKILRRAAAYSTGPRTRSCLLAAAPIPRPAPLRGHLSHLNLEGVDVDGVNLRSADLTEATMSDADQHSCNGLAQPLR